MKLLLQQLHIVIFVCWCPFGWTDTFVRTQLKVHSTGVGNFSQFIEGPWMALSWFVFVYSFSHSFIIIWFPLSWLRLQKEDFKVLYYPYKSQCNNIVQIIVQHDYLLYDKRSSIFVCDSWASLLGSISVSQTLATN